jgi:hypothetical protein
MPVENQPFVQMRLVFYFVLAVLINSVMDGLPRGLPSPQLVLLPLTIIFLSAYWCMLHPQKLISTLERFSNKVTWRTCVWLSMLFVAAGFVVVVHEAQYYRSFGYRLYPIATAALFTVVLGFLWLAQSRQQISGRTLFLIILGCYLAFEIFSIVNFPLDIRRSDMFAMIGAEGGELARGHNPFHLYMSPETDYCAYLPFLLASYIPGILLRIDLRWVATAYMVLTASIAFWAAKPAHRRIVAALLGTYLLSNYVIYRHEIYLQIYWLMLMIMAILLSRGRTLAAALALGIAIGTSQLTLAIFPFLLLHALQKDGWIKAIKATAVTLGSAAAILIPFVVWKPNTMLYGIAGRYYGHNSVNARPMNLVYWIAHVVPPNHMQLVQMAALVSVFGVAVLKRSCRDAAGCLAMMMTAYLLFIMLNVLLDGYFYLTFLVLAIAYLCTVNSWWAEPLAI